MRLGDEDQERHPEEEEEARGGAFAAGLVAAGEAAADLDQPSPTRRPGELRQFPRTAAMPLS